MIHLNRKVHASSLFIGLVCMLSTPMVWAFPSMVKKAVKAKPQATQHVNTVPSIAAPWIEVGPILRKKMAMHTKLQKDRANANKRGTVRARSATKQRAKVPHASHTAHPKTPREKAIVALLSAIRHRLTTHAKMPLKDPRDREWLPGISGIFRMLFRSKDEKLAARLRLDRYNQKLAKRNKVIKQSIERLLGFYLQQIKNNQKDTTRLTSQQTGHARALAEMIITPCCFTQPASVHGNNVAEATKSALRWLVSKGFSEAQAKSFFVATYGVRVLSVPPGNNLVYIPIVTAILVLLFVVFLIWRWVQPTEGLIESEEGDASEKNDTDTVEDSEEEVQQETANTQE